ncbi:MAG: AMP-binding protein [Vulcanimicrobiaceae bacterium]
MTDRGSARIAALLRDAGDRWILGIDGGELRRRIDREAAALARSRLRRVFIVERDPATLLAGLFAALTAECDVFLGDPQWTAAELARAGSVVECEPPEFDESRIMIPTGGSTGTIRFAMHSWRTLAAAAEALRERFGVDRIDSLCALPLHHVSGLMQVVRALVTGGRVAMLTPRAFAAGTPPAIDPSGFFLSLVPTQLARALRTDENVSWLRRCRAIPLGGAPSWPALLSKARAAAIPLAPCYGTTETAAQFVTLLPAEFAAGNDSVGRALPHARVRIAGGSGVDERAGTIGEVVVAASSLASGYYPESFAEEREFPTGDLGRLDASGYLTLLRRRDDAIISGGEKISPGEVEGAIRATGLVCDVAVLGVPDPEWGSVVVALYVPNDPATGAAELRARVRERLAPFKLPKRWLGMTDLPRNAQGKLNRSRLRELAQLDRAGNRL